MAEVIRLPRMSDTMTEGVIVEWHKKVGDTIKSGDVLADVETDKATLELENYEDGTLLHIGVDKGQAAKVDSVIAVVGEKGEDFANLIEENKSVPMIEDKKEGEENSDNSNENIIVNANVIRLPLLSDTMTEGKIVKWHKKVGDTVGSDDVLAEVETDKAVMEVIGYTEGTLLHIGVKEDDYAKVNQIMAIVGEEGVDFSSLLDEEDTPTSTTNDVIVKEVKQDVSTMPANIEQHSNGRVKASPLAKRLALENNIDITLVSGSGTGGRVVKKDIEQTIADPNRQQVLSHRGQVESYQDIPISQMRKTIAKRLSQSKYTAPHFYLTVSVDMHLAKITRQKLNEISDVKISFNDLVIKASATALRDHPNVNSSWHDEYIRTYNHVHVGVAVAVDEGLVVPVVKDADIKSLKAISAETKELAKKARSKRISPSDMEGNTFTISNLGMFNIDEFTGIINSPDACILAVGAIKEVPIVKDGQVVAGSVMKITLSSDHRIVDGVVGAKFLNDIKNYIENPASMLL